MENPTPFDLNAAIRRWQQGLATSPAVGADNLEELAAHLRDSVQRLKATGLSEGEAFLIASRRVGAVEELSGEFSKVNHVLVWRTRTFWMLAGMLVYLGASQCSNLISIASMALCSLFLPNSFWLGFTGIATWMSVIVLVVYLFRLATAGRLTGVNSSMARLLQRRWTAVVVLFFCAITVMAVSGAIMVVLVRNVPSPTLARAFVMRNILYGSENLILPMIILVALTRLASRKSGSGIEAVE